MSFCYGEMSMENSGWDFTFGGGASEAMTRLDNNGGSTDGNGNIECDANSDEIDLSGTFPIANFGLQSNGITSVQGGLQDLDMQDLVGQKHAGQTMRFSSNHLLVAAKLLYQRKLQRDLASCGAHTLSAAHSYPDDRLRLSAHGTQEAAQSSMRRIWEAGTTNVSPSVGSNGSKTSSPQQVSSDSLSSSLIGSAPFFNCSPCGNEQRELLVQARPEFRDGMLDSFNSAFVHMNQIQDATWHPHLQVPRGVLVPSFPNHSGVNHPQIPCNGAAAGKTKPRVRARRGQATDPHSIAERLRRERIAERIKLLQELVPNTNKMDRAIMLDEIIEYVKFLLVQVKLLSMSRLGSAALILPIVAGLPEAKCVQSPAELPTEGTPSPQESMSAIEEHVARMITNNVGSALQFLQRKGLCLVPISLTDASKTSTSTDASVTTTSNLPNSSSITSVAK